jgi:predicted dehydrogenase
MFGWIRGGQWACGQDSDRGTVRAIGRAHAELIARTPGCLLAGIADPATPAADLAARLAAPYFADHRAMLDAVEIDAAIVVMPNARHLPWLVHERGAGDRRSRSPTPSRMRAR